MANCERSLEIEHGTAERCDSSLTPIELAGLAIQRCADSLTKLTTLVQQPVFLEAVKRFAAIEGKIFVSGVGKSGIAARKIAATLSATGTPAVYLDPLGAFHGDLGGLTDSDGVILVSNSGKTHEIVQLVPYLRDRGVYIAAIVGCDDAPLTMEADLSLSTCDGDVADLPFETPIASFHAAVVLGEALAIAICYSKTGGLTRTRLNHPGSQSRAMQ